MNLEKKLIDIALAKLEIVKLLEALREIDLPDSWIAGGCVRGMVWDYMHGYKNLTPLNDIDVIYFDSENMDQGFEGFLEQKLEKICPTGLWEVRNQARMHKRNNDAPYKNSTHAMCFWLETATAVGININKNGCIQVAAPCGLEDLFQLIVRPTPATRLHVDRLACHIRKIENWKKIWPNLQVLE